MKDKDTVFQLDKLNLDDFDVEELEARLELSLAAPAVNAAPGCSGDQGCGVNCQNCKNCYNGCVSAVSCS
jgi:hypothetical protein